VEGSDVKNSLFVFACKVCCRVYCSVFVLHGLLVLCQCKIQMSNTALFVSACKVMCCNVLQCI